MTSYQNKHPSIPFYPSDIHKQTLPLAPLYPLPHQAPQQRDGTFLQMSLFSSPNCILKASNRANRLNSKQTNKKVLESCPVPMDYQMMIPGCSDERGGVVCIIIGTGQVQEILMEGYWFWKGIDSWSPIQFQFGFRSFWVNYNKYLPPVIRSNQWRSEFKNDDGCLENNF
ncbi:hypothetical protein HNY73_018162 [Argiope bruennichi]|uniref:Uncharacterized protein n=1 Tax=Argiope bruennichi TaxID=94029 RepID=A0A8T0ED25_ARGBR|nr:hypothetical protein HNY73_018162 [Argiope bruennichi]